MVANGLFYAGAQYRNVGRGYSLWQALPGQYLLSFAGVLFYGIGGVLDLIWHEFFGVEQGIEEVISPTHLLLITSGMILASGPLRSFLAQDSMPRGWKQLFPPITSALMALSGATLFTRFVNVWALTDHYVPHDIVGSRTAVEAWTVAGVLIPAALTTGTLLFLRQRMVLPFGGGDLGVGGQRADHAHTYASNGPASMHSCCWPRSAPGCWATGCSRARPGAQRSWRCAASHS